VLVNGRGSVRTAVVIFALGPSAVPNAGRCPKRRRRGAMDEPVKLEYVKSVPRVGHSRFGIASAAMAAAIYAFIIAAAFFDITPFESMGNQKETEVAIVAAVLGILLGVRAWQDPQRKRILATLGLVLNALAIPAAVIFLPYI
jgi:hypothetical protein